MSLSHFWKKFSLAKEIAKEVIDLSSCFPFLTPSFLCAFYSKVVFFLTDCVRRFLVLVKSLSECINEGALPSHVRKDGNLYNIRRMRLLGRVSG